MKLLTLPALKLGVVFQTVFGPYVLQPATQHTAPALACVFARCWNNLFACSVKVGTAFGYTFQWEGVRS